MCKINFLSGSLILAHKRTLFKKFHILTLNLTVIITFVTLNFLILNKQNSNSFAAFYNFFLDFFRRNVCVVLCSLGVDRENFLYLLY